MLGSWLKSMLIFGLIQWFCLHLLKQHQHSVVCVRVGVMTFWLLLLPVSQPPSPLSCHSARQPACVNNVVIILLDIHSHRIIKKKEKRQKGRETKPQQAAGVENFTIWLSTIFCLLSRAPRLFFFLLLLITHTCILFQLPLLAVWLSVNFWWNYACVPS